MSPSASLSWVLGLQAQATTLSMLQVLWTHHTCSFMQPEHKFMRDCNRHLIQIAEDMSEFPHLVRAELYLLTLPVSLWCEKSLSLSDHTESELSPRSPAALSGLRLHCQLVGGAEIARGMA